MLNVFLNNIIYFKCIFQVDIFGNNGLYRNDVIHNILDLIYEHLKSKTSITIENPKSSFQTLAVEARSDTLAYVWSKLYLKTVTDFYIDTKTKKSQELLIILGKRLAFQ